ncbi:MAG TPA: MFS transporter [Acidimicrobiales bacterium]|nr:MFS transporter [Acidimicrobiales bacterium]
MPGFLVDISPLRRYRDFRVVWLGQAVSTLGNQLTVVAVPYQVFRITHSSLDVGLVSLAQLGPLLVGSLVGGSLADAFDRRRLLMLTQFVLGLTSVGLALNSSTGRPLLWPLFLLTAVAAGVSGTDSPTRSALVAAVVGRESLAAASSLWQLLFQVGVVVGPSAAGLMLGHIGVAAVYWIDAGTFGVGLLAVMLISPRPPEGGGTRAGLRSIGEGLRFLAGRPVLQANFVIDINAMVFGMPRALFPALGLLRFHGGAATVGALYAAVGAGGLLGAILTGWVPRVHRQGRAVMASVAVWGLAITGFGLVTSLDAAMVLLAVAGASDVASAVLRNTLLQQAVPEALRGRLSAVHIAVVTGGPRLGDLESGAVAAALGAPFSVVTGGLACVAGVVLLGLGYRSYPRYDARAAAPVVIEAG